MRKIITGTFPIKQSKPCVYIVNHKSYLDVIIIASLIPFKIKYLGKAEVFKWPLFGYLAKHSGQIAVQREDKSSRQKGYDAMKQAIADGFSIILFSKVVGVIKVIVDQKIHMIYKKANCYKILEMGHLD